MGALTIVAEFVTGGAIDGSSGPALAAVSLTNLDGVPVSLGEDKFTFRILADPTGQPDSMQHFLNAPATDGFHTFSLFPGAAGTKKRWGTGDYLVGIQVIDTSGRAQTVGAVHVPAS
jgi:hypothetical protein